MSLLRRLFQACPSCLQMLLRRGGCRCLIRLRGLNYCYNSAFGCTERLAVQNDVTVESLGGGWVGGHRSGAQSIAGIR